MSCTPRCKKTASLDGKRRIMVSEPGNRKYPIPFTCHRQCDECVKEEIEEIRYCIALGKSREI